MCDLCLLARKKRKEKKNPCLLARLHADPQPRLGKNLRMRITFGMRTVSNPNLNFCCTRCVQPRLARDRGGRLLICNNVISPVCVHGPVTSFPCNKCILCRPFMQSRLRKEVAEREAEAAIYSARLYESERQMSDW